MYFSLLVERKVRKERHLREKPRFPPQVSPFLGVRGATQFCSAPDARTVAVLTLRRKRVMSAPRSRLSARRTGGGEGCRALPWAIFERKREVATEGSSKKCGQPTTQGRPYGVVGAPVGNLSANADGLQPRQVTRNAKMPFSPRMSPLQNFKNYAII